MTVFDLLEAIDSLQPVHPREVRGWNEDGKFVLEAIIPGYEKDKIQVFSAEDTVTIKAEGSRKGVRDYSQRVRLPKGLDHMNSTAEYRDGILTVTFPKKDGANRKILVT